MAPTLDFLTTSWTSNQEFQKKKTSKILYPRAFTLETENDFGKKVKKLKFEKMNFSGYRRERKEERKKERNNKKRKKILFKARQERCMEGCKEWSSV